MTLFPRALVVTVAFLIIEEARSKRMVYEHQEDSEQKVRVWAIRLL